MAQADIEDIGKPAGLSEEEAARRLREQGPNELPGERRRGLLYIVLGVLREPMFLLLLGCGALYLVLGDPGEALTLLGFVVIIIGITVLQERRTERALEALRDLSSPRALVVRGGERRRVAGREVVEGDVVLLSEGDRVPADARLLSVRNLMVDESLLTGEAVPVRKAAPKSAPAGPGGPGDRGAPGGDDQPFVYSGTLVTRGRGVARVTATGPRTEMGRIGKALQREEPAPSLLQQQARRLVRVIAAVGVAVCAALALLLGAQRGRWLEGLLAGLTLAMALLPEEIPVIMTIFLALGAWRMSRQRVLARRVPAVEALGAATVLCVDKTGTLTHNRMTVTHLCVDARVVEVRGDQAELPEEVHELVEYAILASPPDPFDPMERAMQELGARTLARTEHLHRDWTLLREYPLSPAMLAVSHVWRSPDEAQLVVAAKGAPEAVFDLCHLPPARTAELHGDVERLASAGLRVIAVARARFPAGALPPEQHDFAFELVGLLGLSDPVRAEVPAAVADCRAAGVRVVMITGDYAGTARDIALRAGLGGPGGVTVMTGPELSALDELDGPALAARIGEVDVFARVVPEQKLRIVRALQARGEVVAMTGDGVNDAPALKAAHIGVAMGGRGTDVAREAAALVLLDDHFASIVAAVRMGRRIFDNLRKALSFTVAVHVPIAGMSLLPALLGWPLVLLPAHVLFLELIIDPACSVVFEAEPEERDVMRRPPRRLDDPLFGRRALVRAGLQGLFALGIALAVFARLLRERGEGPARAACFVAMVLLNLGLIFASRTSRAGRASRAAGAGRSAGAGRTVDGASGKPPFNAALLYVAAGAPAVLALVLGVPLLRQLFHFGAPSLRDLAVGAAAGLVGVAALVLTREVGRREAA